MSNICYENFEDVKACVESGYEYDQSTYGIVPS